MFASALCRALQADDLEGASKFLEETGTTQTSRGHTIQKEDKLDYRRYSESLFDVLLTGGLLGGCFSLGFGFVCTLVHPVPTRRHFYPFPNRDAITARVAHDILHGVLPTLLFAADACFPFFVVAAPGGSPVDDDAPRNPLSVFETDGSDAAVKKVAEFIRDLIRRYKYLQVLLEEEMEKILKFVKAFSDEDQLKLAKCTGYFLSFGLVTAKPFMSLNQEAMVKEGIAATFLLQCLKTWLSETSLNSMSGGMRKAGLDTEVLNFFPPNRRTMEYFTELAEKIGGMDDVVAWQKVQQLTGIKRNLQSDIIEMVSREEADADAVIEKVQEVMAESGMKETDVIAMIWTALMNSVEWNKKPEQVAEQALHHLKAYHTVFAAFATSHRAQVQLLVRIQNFSYDNQSFIKIFNKVVLLMYKADVLGEDAILEFYAKAHSSKGKDVFLAQLKPMVEWLQEAETESEEEG